MEAFIDQKESSMYITIIDDVTWILKSCKDCGIGTKAWNCWDSVREGEY